MTFLQEDDQHIIEETPNDAFDKLRSKLKTTDTAGRKEPLKLQSTLEAFLAIVEKDLTGNPSSSSRSTIESVLGFTVIVCDPSKSVKNARLSSSNGHSRRRRDSFYNHSDNSSRQRHLSGSRQSYIAFTDKRRSSLKKDDKGEESSKVNEGSDDHERPKRTERRSSEVQSQENDDLNKPPEGRRLSGWELREKLKKSPGRNSPGYLPNALTGSRHTFKRHESLNASAHSSSDNRTHSDKPHLNLSSHHFRCANLSRAHSRTADSAFEQDDDVNLLKSPAADKNRWRKLTACTGSPSVPARAPVTPVNRKCKIELVVNCPSSVQSCPAVRKWSKLTHDNQFVNETRLQAKEARQIRETFASPTRVAAWKIREQLKKGRPCGGRCASDLSAALPPAFRSSMDRRGSAPTYAMSKKSRASRNQTPDLRRSNVLDSFKSLVLDDNDARKESKNGSNKIDMELGEVPSLFRAQ
jgi:hypothetical protein